MKITTDIKSINGKIIEKVVTNKFNDTMTIFFSDGSNIIIEVCGREDGSHGLTAEFKMTSSQINPAKAGGIPHGNEL